MKDEITSLVILAALGALFALNSYTVNTTPHSLTDEIRRAEQEAISDFDATREFESVQKKWQKERKALFYLCGHSIITQIDEYIGLGCEYMALGNRDRAVFFFKKARLGLEDLSDREKIKLDNIF